MGINFLSRVYYDRTRGTCFKLKGGRFRLDIRKKFFTPRVVKPCPRLPREVGDAPSLGAFQARLVGALSNRIQLERALPMARGWAGWP